MAKTKFTPEDRAVVLHLLQHEQRSVAEIAKMCGCSTSTVYRIRKAAGVQSTPRKNTRAASELLTEARAAMSNAINHLECDRIAASFTWKLHQAGAKPAEFGRLECLRWSRLSQVAAPVDIATFYADMTQDAAAAWA